MKTIDDKIDSLKMMGYEVINVASNCIEVRLNIGEYVYWVVVPIYVMKKDFIIESIVNEINSIVVSAYNIKNSRFYDIVNKNIMEMENNDTL